MIRKAKLQGATGYSARRGHITTLSKQSVGIKTIRELGGTGR